MLVITGDEIFYMIVRGYTAFILNCHVGFPVVSANKLYPFSGLGHKEKNVAQR